MTLRFLLDTNIFSETLRPEPSERVMRRLKRSEGQVVTAAVVYHELVFGMCRLPKSKKRAFIEKYLEEVIRKTILILPYDEKAASLHGIWRAQLAAKGIGLPFADGQIASIARSNDLVLVTRNTSDFQSLPELKLANWFE